MKFIKMVMKAEPDQVDIDSIYEALRTAVLERRNVEIILSDEWSILINPNQIVWDLLEKNKCLKEQS